jgi:N-acetylglucosaminyl-diphospho-decaprenol L-rhamnosyltransferase
VTELREEGQVVGSFGETPAFVVHWKNPEALERTLAALEAQSVPLRITVVDNASPPERAARVRGAVELVQSERNEGYGPALNRVLQAWLARPGGRYAVICPHDALPRPDCVANLLAEMQKRPRIGLASAEYGQASLPGYTLLRGYDLYPAPRGTGFCPTEYPNGTLFVVARDCLEQIGLFDERYFAYGEECDLGCRALAAGWEVGQVWGAVVENPGRVASSRTVWYLNLRNGLLASRQRDGLPAAALRSLLTLGRGAWDTLKRAEGEGVPPFSVRARAVSDFWRRRFGPPPALP